MKDKTNSGLSGDCQAILAMWEMYALPDEGSGFVSLFSDEGDFMGRAAADIRHEDLLMMLRYGRDRFNDGKNIGAMTALSNIRAALGVKQ